MKRILLILILLLALSIPAIAGFFGFINDPAMPPSSTGAASGDALLLESGDALLLETGDKLLLE